MNQEPPEHARIDGCSDAQTAIVHTQATYATQRSRGIGRSTAAKTGATWNSVETTAEAWKIASTATMENALVRTDMMGNAMDERQVLYITERGII